MNIKEKIKVFISSKCGVDKYDIVREGLKGRLEDTGFIDVYVFEVAGACSKSAIDAYINKLDDCDLIIFLIDNEDEKFPEGVMKEYLRAKDLHKKSIYLFLNLPDKDETSIQKSLYGPNGPKFISVNNIKEFIGKGYESIIEDIFSIYKDYCRDRLSSKNTVDEAEDLDNGKNIILNEIEKYQMKKSILSKVNNVYSYFIEKNKFCRKQDSRTYNELEKSFMYFAQLILCEEEFKEHEIDKLISLIVDYHTEDNRGIIRKRWESIKYCYNDNVEDAIDSLYEAYNSGIECKVAEWIVDDILIDKRNLESIMHNQKNIIADSESQKVLTQKENILYYPVLDRLSKDIYCKIIEEKNKIDISTPYTSNIGTGIDKILSTVGEYFILAVYYGSYTHIKLVRKLLQDIFYNYYKIYNVNEWGFEALRYSILNDNSKFIKDICDRNSNVISVCSVDNIDKLYSLATKVDLKYYRDKLKIKIFNHLGYYFSDYRYNIIEKEIIDIFNEWLYSIKPTIYLGEDIFKAIQANVNRISIRKIVEFLIASLNKKYYRFYDNIFKTIRLIPYSKLNEEQVKELLDIIINIVKDKEEKYKYYELKYCLIYLRKTKIEECKRLDDIIENHWGEIKDDYYLEVLEKESEHYKSILGYVEEIRERNLTQGNGLYYGYVYNPEDIIGKILKYSKVNILDRQLLQIITEVCKESLSNEKQTVSEKVSCIQLLIYLINISHQYNITFDWKNYNSSFNEEKILEAYVDGFFDKDSRLTLSSNYIMYKVFNGYADEEELLEILSYYDGDNVYENIKILDTIKCFMENGVSDILERDIYIILLQFITRYINDKNYEVKYRVVNCLFKIRDKFTRNVIYKYIEITSNDLDYRVKLNILNNIDDIKNQDEKNIFKYVIEKYSVDNNYLVRNRARNILL
jgi:hypothetical protein